MNDIPAPDRKDSPAPSLGFDFPESPAKAAPYRVLARKYRPTRFEDLIGQEPMVRTLANSFASGRIHQAYILTGVRGIGKTTTARILARAFNYSLPGKIDRPSIDMPELGVHCQAIIESRHVDVIEMDAASHTGIDDVREIIENARYRPVSARTKVYIIDEVHMLSKQAFNGLLKTLEEPPEHVKFLFATTEIEKVPITVRSRCLRFDLKRIESAMMTRHLIGICQAESVAFEADALPLIARVAEGSVRDALSLLDQAIAHGAEGGVQAAGIRAMLGLSDKGHIIDLFEFAMKGDLASGLALMEQLHQAGADPAQLLIELAEFSHFVTRLKLAPKGIDDPTIGEDERRRGAEFAEKLGLGPLTRAWQILLKGVQDVKDSPRPLASAEMALIRLGYAADLPAPEDALRKLADAAEAGPRSAPPSQPPARPSGGSGLHKARRRQSRRRPQSLRRQASGWRASRTSSPSRGPSAIFNCRARLRTMCVFRVSRRAVLRSRLIPGPRRRLHRPCRAACRNGRASGGWWRLSRARPRRHCGKTPPPEKPSASAASPPTLWCARS
jgi:DNA polymerase III subunit gamma/tau